MLTKIEPQRMLLLLKMAEKLKFNPEEVFNVRPLAANK